MKSGIFLSLLLCLSLLSGCFASPAAGGERTFEAVIVELSGTSALVEPDEGTDERKSSDRITFDTEELDDIGASVGSRVSVTYTGGIMESYPARIRAVSWSSVEDEELAAAIQKANELSQTVNTEEAVEVSSPPPLVFNTGEHDYTLGSGGGSWSYKTKSGGRQHIETDMLHPLDPMITLPGLPYNGEYAISFDGEVQPDTISVICWKSAYITSDDIRSAPFEEIEPDGNIFIPKNDGEYVYRITAQWTDNGGAYYGTGHYIFTVFGGELQYDKDNSIDYKAQYIYTNNLNGDEIPPPIIIGSPEELGNYYNENSEKYNFNSSDEKTNFKDAVQGYDKAFFDKKHLIVIVQRDTCGSLEYEVKSVYDDGRIIVWEIHHPIDTAIINYRHIIIEVDNDSPHISSSDDLKVTLLRMMEIW